MTLLVDTSVWSLAFRRDINSDAPPVDVLRAALAGGDSIVTTGLILQELLQGFAGPRDRKRGLWKDSQPYRSSSPIDGTTSMQPSFAIFVAVRVSRSGRLTRYWHSYASATTLRC